MEDSEILVSIPEIKSFVERCMVAAGKQPGHATCMAEILVAADQRGHLSHGLNRLEMYVNQNTVSDREPEVIKETAATAHVDGHNMLGPVVGNFCMDLAIKKAQKAGVGWVVAKGCNHFGIAGFYALQASNKGLLPMLGTNAIAMAAPGKDRDAFVLDMATSAVACGKVQLCDRKGAEMPIGWGCDSEGKVTTHPKEMLEGGGLLPLGGLEETSGYKGYGLSMMVEIFCGILGGAKYGPNIRMWTSKDAVADLGQCFVAINPDAFAPGFPDRMQDLMDTCRTAEPAEGKEEVLVAGDPERIHMAKCNAEGGIRYHPNVIKHMDTVAARLKVAPLKAKK